MTIKCKAVSIDRDDTAYEALAPTDGSFAEVNTRESYGMLQAVERRDEIAIDVFLAENKNIYTMLNYAYLLGDINTQ